MRGSLQCRLFGCAVTLLLLLAVDSARAAESPPPETTFRATLDRHLQAINARDLPALLATVTGGDALTTILPNGKVLQTRAQYEQLHVDWFKDHDWKMLFDVQEIRMLGDSAIARVRYDSQVRESGADNSKYTSKRIAQLTLVFTQEKGQWRLVYDQNTVVPPPQS